MALTRMMGWWFLREPLSVSCSLLQSVCIWVWMVERHRDSASTTASRYQ